MTYILPIRSDSAVSQEFVRYLEFLTTLDTLAEVIVVDGSAEPVFADLETRCHSRLQHVKVDPWLRELTNGKAAGVLTGVRRATQPFLLIADEDVRYDATAVTAMADALEQADVVRPQNFFDPLPWHACIDTARTLINRVTGGDWPGTLGVRKALLERTDGYDGNVLFENLELVRTVTAAGGREACPLDLFVRRLPPKSRHFWTQRVRQAYDEFARPPRLAVWLCILPALIVSIAVSSWIAVAAWTLAPILIAETGRRVGGGARVFSGLSSLVAPLWVLERAICAWIAVGLRCVVGGVHYRGRVVSRAATPYRTLRQRYTQPRLLRRGA